MDLKSQPEWQHSAYIFTPEGIVSIEKVDTFSPTAQRHALRIPFGESASTKQIVSDNPSAVNSGAGVSTPISDTQMSMIENTFRYNGELVSQDAWKY